MQRIATARYLIPHVGERQTYTASRLQPHNLTEVPPCSHV